MAENTGIQWANHTFNPWSGCTKVSPGCANCYAEVNYSVKMRGVKWGPQGNRIVAAESGWGSPKKWNAIATLSGERHRVFCASLADVFEDWEGPMKSSAGDELYDNRQGGWSPDYRDKDGHRKKITMQDVRSRLFRLIDETPSLDWLVLTKRPENIEKMMPPINPVGEPFFFGTRTVQTPDGKSKVTTLGKIVADRAIKRGEVVEVSSVRKNLWLGVSVENQEEAINRIPVLTKIPAAVRFLSCEPLLGPIDLKIEHVEFSDSLEGPVETWYDSIPEGIHWVIIGGESGPKARVCRVEWVRDIVGQCYKSEVACFVKQLGSNVRDKNPMSDGFKSFADWQDGSETYRVLLEDSHGGMEGEWPLGLRIRQFPK